MRDLRHLSNVLTMTADDSNAAVSDSNKQKNQEIIEEGIIKEDDTVKGHEKMLFKTHF
jgi:hypothetical protein